MNWLNLHTSTLDSPEFIGSEPVDRATWLSLLRYCVGQENSGRIENSKEWKDRKWQQIVRVTLKEIRRDSDLWTWCGDDLVVWGYPIEKESEVKTNRLNGASGGRPKKKAKGNHPVSNGETTRLEIAETERKGKEIEGEGKEKGAEITPPLVEELSDSMPLEAAASMAELQSRINSLHPKWKARPHFIRSELEELMGSAKALQATSEADWKLLAIFMDAEIPEAWGRFWQPDNRGQLIRAFTDVMGHADRWKAVAARNGIKIDLEGAA